MSTSLRFAAVLAACQLAGCSPTLNWREVRADDAAAHWLMPCRPDRQARELELAGRRVRLALASCLAGDQTWAVSAADLGDPALVPTAIDELEAAARANIQAPANSVQTLELRVPGATPGPWNRRLAFAGRLPDGTAIQEQIALFSRGGRVYEATALGATLDAQALETFFGSMNAGE